MAAGVTSGPLCITTTCLRDQRPHYILHKMRFFLSALLLWIIPTVLAQDPPVLDQRIMELSVEAAKLSALVYANATDYEVGVDGNGTTLYEHPDYEVITFYTDEPDQAIIAKGNDGRCYVAFRGTTLEIDDWFQNIETGDIDIYKDNNNATGESCNSRIGYADFLLSNLVLQGSQELVACAAGCSDPDDCIVITGHSQGGATALLGAIILYSFNPLVITFGQPLTLTTGCELIRSERVYRYVNSLFVDDAEDPGVDYDPVPLLPALFQARSHYGYYLLLGDDTTALKYLGIDGEDSDFAPGPQISAAPHSMGLPIEYSYEARVTALLDNNVFPVAITGFAGGVPCDVYNSLTCSSDECSLTDMACTGGAPTGAPVEGPTNAPVDESPTNAPVTSSALDIQITATTTFSLLGYLVPLFL